MFQLLGFVDTSVFNSYHEIGLYPQILITDVPDALYVIAFQDQQNSSQGEYKLLEEIFWVMLYCSSGLISKDSARSCRDSCIGNKTELNI